MSETTVIHVRDANLASGDIYIGRRLPRRGFYRDSPWANPFSINREHDRYSVLCAFDAWVRSSDDPRAAWIREHIEDLRGHRLACWCTPFACHGEIYVKLLAETAVPS